jgi:hypothetical protein
LKESRSPRRMRRVRKGVVLVAVALALLAAGGASAYVVARTIWLKPGHCRVVHGRKVCARKAKPRTVTHTTTVVHWSAQPDRFGDNSFVVSSSPDDANSVEFDNGSGATFGSSFIPAGTYTFEVTASAAWTLSF